MQAPDNSPRAAPEGPGLTVVLVVFGLGLLALAGWMGWEFYHATAVLSWPTTEGVVLKSRLMEITKTSGNKQYKLETTYAYAVNGQKHTGTTFNTRGNYLDRDTAREVARQYAAGAKCAVHYSPGSPDQSVLIPERTWHAWGKLAIGILAAFGALALFVVVFRKPKPAA